MNPEKTVPQKIAFFEAPPVRNIVLHKVNPPLRSDNGPSTKVEADDHSCSSGCVNPSPQLLELVGGAGTWCNGTGGEAVFAFT